uniref:MAK10-like protein n=1 Tax=Tanacetum cinerariifolium TaxID=118510 RepID=A0A699GXU2_TANCI|nr:hypothetical protein [Tanacetum cinerariifolium]
MLYFIWCIINLLGWNHVEYVRGSLWSISLKRTLAEWLDSSLTEPDENPIRTLGYYSKPSHEGYRNTIELSVGNSMDPLPHGRNLLLDSLLDSSTRKDRKTLQRYPDTTGGKLRDLNAKESWALLEDLALYDDESWNDPRDFANPVKAITLPQDVPSTSDRHLIELENQYYMEDPEQAFVKYASSRTDEAGGKWYTFKPEQNNLGDTYNPLWRSHPNLSLGDSKPFDTLADLGSCVNIISLYLFKKLNIRLLEETGHIFGLADETKSYPVGIVKDVEVHIGKLNDFYVIDMKEDPKAPLLVGRGFLATANIVIDCRMAKIAIGERIIRLISEVQGVNLGEEEVPYQTKLGKRESYKS